MCLQKQCLGFSPTFLSLSTTHPPPATNHREPIALGKAYANYPCVRQFKILPNLGHCPMDEGPEQVNPFIREFVDTLEKEAKAKAQ